MITRSIISKYKKMNRPAKAAVWFLICSFLQKGISVITTPIFTRLLTTAEYGQYNVFNSWFGIINIFVSLMLSGGVCTQGLVKFDEERKVFASSLQGLTLTMVIAWTIIYVLFHTFWNNILSLTTVQCLAMLVMIWTGAVFNLWAAEQRVEYNYKLLVFITLLVSVAKPAIGISLVKHSEDKVTARILGIAIVELIGYTGLFFSQLKNGKVFFSKKYWIYAIGFNIPLIPHYLSQAVLSSSDRIMIQSMVGDDAAGIYSLAYSISSIMVIFNSALMNTITPWIFTKIKNKKLEDIAGISYITIGIVAFANLALIAFAPEAVRIFAPDSYYDAIYVIPPIAMSVYFTYLYDVFAKFQFYYEKTKFIMIASVAAAILNIFLNYIFIPKFGYYAAGYTTLICYIIYTLLHYCFMNKICRDYLDGYKVFDVKILIMISGSMLVCGFVMLYFYEYVYIRYTLIFIVLILCIISKNKISLIINKLIKIKIQ